MSAEEMKKSTTDIFQRLKSGETIPADDPDFYRLSQASEQAIAELVNLNASKSLVDIHKALSQLIGTSVDESTMLYTPFSINYGKNLKLGKNIFINQNCQMLDLGGITIEDGVMIGPRVTIISETHPLDPALRKSLIGKLVTIKENAWIGANATILPGVTVGKNAVVGAGAVVTKDVPDNAVVTGVPAQIIKSI